MAQPASSMAAITAARGSRAGVLFRWSWREGMRSKAVLLLLNAAGVVWLIFAILIYLHYNLAALRALDLDISRLLPIDAGFFSAYLGITAAIAFFLALLAGPPLLTRDLANNGLALYFSRPLSRADYVIGKMGAPLVLLSAVTWAPGLLLFFLQAYLAGAGWAARNFRLAAALFLGGALWAVMLTLLAFALAAWLKRRMAASAAFVGLLFIPGLVAGVVDSFLAGRRWGDLISPIGDMRIVWNGLFGLSMREPRIVFGRHMLVITGPPPAWSAWLALAAIAGLCLWLLHRRLRPYEEVRG